MSTIVNWVVEPIATPVGKRDMQTPIRKWILDHIDSVPKSLRTRMEITLSIMDRNPEYAPNITAWEHEISIIQSQPSTINPCPGFDTWCPRFGLPIGKDSCEICKREGMEFKRELRELGYMFGAMICSYRVDTGEVEEHKCCGNKTTLLKVYDCSLKGGRAKCLGCKEKR